MLSAMADNDNKRSARRITIFRRILRYIILFGQFFKRNQRKDDSDNGLANFRTIKQKNDEFVLEKLRQLENDDNQAVIKRMILEYETSLSFQNVRNKIDENSKERENEASMSEMMTLGFQIERDNIQAMFENGRISRETAKELRNNISLSEMELKNGSF
jgi:CPA1 family monovalent cation:H+ antiporter